MYLHISQPVLGGIKLGHGITYNIGRNAKKRSARAGKPRKQWRKVA